MTQNIYYTYFYLRKDGTPYYVGKGKNGRAHSTQKRVRRPPEKERIVFPEKNVDEFTAFHWERFWISFYGRKDLGTGILLNQTDGGEGPSNRIFSEESRKKMSESAKNRPEEDRRKHSEFMSGKEPWNKGRKETREEVLKRQSESHQNPSEEVRKKNADGHRGKTHSDDTKQRMSDKKKGKPPNNKGKKMPIVICPHCNKSGGSSGMKKYHFDRCKFKLT
jgi:hypothetical protein